MANLKIGDRVGIDVCAEGSDRMSEPQYHGCIGMITKVETEGAGVGESEEDPFYTVQFAGGVHDGFWREEMVPMPPSTKISKVPPKPGKYDRHAFPDKPWMQREAKRMKTDTTIYLVHAEGGS